MLRDHSFDTIAQNVCPTAVFKPSKNSVSLTILLSCYFKGLVFDFYLNRKRNMCWLAAYSLHISKFILINRHFAIDLTTLPDML